MARGTAVGEPVVSKAQSKEFDEGYERVFGNKGPTRGRWIWDPRQKKMVLPEEYHPEPSREARFAPIMSDRFYEGVKTVGDNVDIGSRTKRREYMKQRGLADADDFSPEYLAKEKRAAELRDQKERREVIAKAYWQSVEGKLKRGNNGRGNE